jgi:Bacterial conjugation TrbI-like protein
MKSKLKLKDLPLLIKSDRRYQIGLVVLLVVVFWPLIDPTKKIEHVPPPRLVAPPLEGSGRTSDEEQAKDLVDAFKGELDDTKARITRIEDSVNKQSENLKNFEERTAGIFKKVLERVAESEKNISTTGDNNIPPVDLQSPDGAQIQPVTLNSNKIEPLFGSEEEQQVAPPAPRPERDVVIGPGDSVAVETMVGVDAETNGNPYPIVMKIVDNIHGPDNSTLSLGEARVIAACQGDLVSSRALCRLTRLNLRLPNGRRKFVAVDGWIVGEDGIRGMSGVLIDPISKAILGAGMVGALAGFGDGVSQANTTTIRSAYGGSESFVSGNVGQYAAGKGVSNAASTWGDIIKDRLEMMSPQVRVLSGRKVHAIFAKEVVIPDLYDALEEEEEISASSFD